MPETKKKKKDIVPVEKNEREKNEIIKQFFSLEEKKLEIEKLRSENEAKELEISAKSSKEATQLAAKDLENQKYYIDKNYSFKDRIASKIFWLTVLIIVVTVGIIIFLSQTSPEILDKLLNYIQDIIKIIIGAVIGYLFRANKNPKSNNQIDEEQ